MQYEQIVAMLPDYLAGNLNAKQSAFIEQQLANSEQLREELATLESLTNLSEQWQEETVPEWHRTAYATHGRQTQTHWSQWFSMAASFAAVLLVAFQVNIHSDESGLHIAFGNTNNHPLSQDEQLLTGVVETQVNRLLDAWSAEQAAYVDHRLLAFENKQLKTQQQLLAATYEVNREQRHQELMQLTKVLLQQRNQDQLHSRSQYRELYDEQSEHRQVINNLLTSYQPNNPDSE
jgi:antitoxin component of MazEF toxin-antitoxin module